MDEMLALLQGYLDNATASADGWRGNASYCTYLGETAKADICAERASKADAKVKLLTRAIAIIKAARDVVPPLERVCCLLADREAVKMLEGAVASYDAHHKTRKELDTFLEAMKGVG